MVWYIFCLPTHLFTDPTSMILEDADGNLLGARIAADGQWRFPYNDAVPDKFAVAITTFEDKRFFTHPGIDMLGIAKAAEQNIRNGRIVRGGSTLTMQTLRMSRKGKPRNIPQKIIEAILATRLELRESKSEILALYASNAPFGGNVVGLDAASWRYYGKRPDLLSWSEAATLAVLPNSPALIHPGRNRRALMEKRNRLLDRLLAQNKIDTLTCELAKEEPLPDEPLPLPRLAPHLLNRAFVECFSDKKKKGSSAFSTPQPPPKGETTASSSSRSEESHPLEGAGGWTRLRTTIDRNLQEYATRTLHRHHARLSSNGIHNLAAVIVEVETGNVVAYVGNIFSEENAAHEHEVDVITAARSSGSILKPFLYGMMLDEGEILPQSLIPDVPTNMSGYRPLNFYETYDGAVPARKAIIRSLNVPTVRMLSDYGLEKFHFNLKKMGFSTLNKPASHYGLTLVLGGSEVTLWDVTNAYTCMARTLNHHYPHNSKYDAADWRDLNYFYEKKDLSISLFGGGRGEDASENKLTDAPTRMGTGAIYQTFETMRQVERPNSSGAWQLYESSKRIAWKTGTSFGFRDAWAVGVTPRYTVGVWAGNADGEGKAGLVGVQAAAPVLFDLFERLPTGGWFEPPYDDMVVVDVCTKSGYRALENCEKTEGYYVSARGVEAQACPYHQMIHLDDNQQFRVHSDCENPSNMQHEKWFVLPPLEEFYYKKKHPDYRVLPPFRDDCLASLNTSKNRSMQLIYPKPNSSIFIPKDMDGELGKAVFKVAHREPESVIYWHLNDEYIEKTKTFHELELSPEPGKYKLTLVDEQGARLEEFFEVLGRE